MKNDLRNIRNGLRNMIRVQGVDLVLKFLTSHSKWTSVRCPGKRSTIQGGCTLQLTDHRYKVYIQSRNLRVSATNSASRDDQGGPVKTSSGVCKKWVRLLWATLRLDGYTIVYLILRSLSLSVVNLARSFWTATKKSRYSKWRFLYFGWWSALFLVSGRGLCPYTGSWAFLAIKALEGVPGESGEIHILQACLTAKMGENFSQLEIVISQSTWKALGDFTSTPSGRPTNCKPLSLTIFLIFQFGQKLIILVLDVTYVSRKEGARTFLYTSMHLSLSHPILEFLQVLLLQQDVDQQSPPEVSR